MLVSELELECEKRGISTNHLPNTRRDGYLHLLKNHDEQGTGKVSRSFLKHYTTQMLCYSFDKIDLQEKKEILLSSDWIAEPKYYGNRVFISYLPEEGYRYYSRGFQTGKFLQRDLTDRLFDVDTGGHNNISFLLDGMIVLNSRKSKPERDSHTGLESNAVSFLMSIPIEDSLSLQRKYARLSIVVFDIVMLDGKNTCRLSYTARQKLLSDLASCKIRGVKDKIPFIIPRHVSKNKVDFYNECVSNGYEGVVVKNIHKPYNSTVNRDKEVQVKIKKDCCKFSDDIDVFISRITVNNHLELSSYFQTSSGVVYEVCVGYVKFPTTIRITTPIVYDDYFGDHLISPEVVGKVVTAKASRFSLETQKFKSIRVNWRKGFRTDKGKSDCVLTEEIVGSEFLNNVIR